jgi:hypothetical protein
MKIWLRSCLAVALLILYSLAARADHWTAVASTGAVDESAAGIFQFSGQSFSHLAGSGSTLPVVARYNVTNTTGTETPAWTTLELGYTDANANNQVVARLIQVSPCTNTQQVLCTVTSSDSTVPTCKTCQFSVPINFTNFLYFVEVTVSRTVPSVNPGGIAHTLRIY